MWSSIIFISLNAWYLRPALPFAKCLIFNRSYVSFFKQNLVSDVYFQPIHCVGHVFQVGYCLSYFDVEIYITFDFLVMLDLNICDTPAIVYLMVIVFQLFVKCIVSKWFKVADFLFYFKYVYLVDCTTVLSQVHFQLAHCIWNTGNFDHLIMVLALS